MLAQRLRQLRKDKSLTLQQVAKELGVTRACVSKWETGASQPDIARLSEIAAVYSLSTSDLLSESSSTDPAAPPSYPVISLVNGEPIEALLSATRRRFASHSAHSVSAFFVALGDYMVAHFGLSGVPRDALLLVEPEAQAYSGDLVLAHSKALGYQVLAGRDNGGQLELISMGIKLAHLGPIADAKTIGVVVEAVSSQPLRGFALRHSPKMLFA
jgi:transcriptional regulator with XRE-family HTH domain